MKPTLVATGEKWIGYGIRSSLSVIQELMANTKNELALTVYIISSMSIVNSIEACLDRGIHVEIFIYSPELRTNNAAMERIREIRTKYEYLSLHEVTTDVLHAKILVSDGKRVLIGSANPTYSGMVRNYEMGLLLDDGRIANNIIDLLRRLAEQ